MLRLKIENILKNHNLSVTKSRKRVLKSFLKLMKPLSLKEIRLLVGDMDRVTLFRVLAALEKKQIIHKIRLENNQDLFALCEEECGGDNHSHSHVHFQCESCDDVSCLSINNFPRINVPEYIFNSININVSGFCSKCS